MVISYNIVIIVPKNTKSDERNNPSFQKLTQENMERIEKKKLVLGRIILSSGVGISRNRTYAKKPG